MVSRSPCFSRSDSSPTLGGPAPMTTTRSSSSRSSVSRAVITLVVEAIALLGQVPPGPEQRRELARNGTNRGTLLKKLNNRFAEAEADYRRALDLRERLADEFADHPEYARELATW